MVGLNPRARYCSRRCKENAKQRREYAAEAKHPQIAECGTHSGYVCHRKRGEDACADCKAASAEYQREPARRAVRNDASHRRRARIRGAIAAPISRREVFDAHGWICALCGHPVDQLSEPRSPMSASLDHIVPISRGGSHTRANVQLAHLVCNMRKSNRLDAP